MTPRQAILKAFAPAAEKERMAFRMSSAHTMAHAEDLVRSIKGMNGSLVNLDKFLRPQKAK